MALHITSPNLSFAKERSLSGTRLEADADGSQFGAFCIFLCVSRLIKRGDSYRGDFHYNIH